MKGGLALLEAELRFPPQSWSVSNNRAWTNICSSQFRLQIPSRAGLVPHFFFWQFPIFFDAKKCRDAWSHKVGVLAPPLWSWSEFESEFEFCWVPLPINHSARLVAIKSCRRHTLIFFFTYLVNLGVANTKTTERSLSAAIALAVVWRRA